MSARDVVQRVAPLGLRFWDDADARLVRDGLEVWVWPVQRPDRRQRAVVNGSAAWSVHGLWGLAELERGSGDVDYWDRVEAGTDPRFAPRLFTISVDDIAGRFLPVQWTLALPQRGLYSWPPESPPFAAGALSALAPAGVVPLFSAPQRRTVSRSVVRAELEAVESREPLAGALVELWQSTLLARGLADADGRVLLAFAPPEMAEPGGIAASASLSEPGGALRDWQFAAELRVHWAPRAASDERVDLLAVFEQPERVALLSESPPLPLGEIVVHRGAELVVRSLDSRLGRLAVRTAA